ncbi:MAG: hypothetical protein KA715_06175 [Xanthomonadaceae bacterium]|nr:hypothetical protein [Xanthomonadaceae bacterium]
MYKQISFALISFVLSLIGATRTLANPFEFTIEASYSRQQYDPTSFTWNRRWAASVGYTILNMSEIELSIQKIDSQTVYGTFQNVTYSDNVYSVDLVQSLLPRSYFFQPYARLGIGQLNRNASGTFANGTAPPAILDSITGVIGLGTKIFLSRRFAIRFQAISYLSGGNISTWSQNISTNLGITVVL